MKIWFLFLILIQSVLANDICYDGSSLSPDELDLLKNSNHNIEHRFIKKCLNKHLGPLRDCSKLSESNVLTCLKENIKAPRNCCLEMNKEFCEDEIYFATYSSAKIVNKYKKASLNECSDFTPSKLKINYINQSCSNGRVIDLQLKNLLKTALPSCLESSLNEAGFKGAKLSNLVHAGVLADQNHKSYSSHADGKAIDLKEISFITKTGENKVFKFSQAASEKSPANNSFYEEFRRCWDEKLVELKGCKRPRQPGYFGSSGFRDSDISKHKHHLHIELPRSCLNI